MFLVNSRLSHFSVTLNSLGGKPHHHQEHPFSRSYGANWSSSLRGVLPSALEYSSHPPVSVLVRSLLFSLEVFLDSVESDNPLHPKDSRRITPWSICSLDLPGLPPARLPQLFQQLSVLSSCVTPSLKRTDSGTGIFVPVFHRLRLSASA